MSFDRTIFSEKVKSMQAYHVANSSGMIKLDAMELPYTLPEEMRAALGKILSLTSINRYPNPRSTSTIAKIKQVFSLPEACEVMLGNGSDELIQILLTAVAKSNAVVMSPVPSFVMYQQTAELLGMSFVGIDLQADFSLDENDFLQAIDKHQPAVIFLAYPNNPTGFLLDKAVVQRIVEAAPGLVVIDEAYTAYADDSAQDLLTQYQHVVLIRTLSKIGLAGIRLGYLVAQPDIVVQLNKARMPYNVNVLTQATTRFMLEQTAFLDDCVSKVLDEKAKLYEWLLACDKVTVFASQTNFLLLRVENATAVFECLRDNYRILVKNLHGYHPVLDNVLRITIGNEKENSALRHALKKILG